MSKTKTRVMDSIKKGKVKMKPKWWFLIREYLLRSGWLVATVGGAVILTTLIYVLELLDIPGLWEFGEVGREVIREQFPYLLVLGVVLMAGLSAASLPLIGENYKKDRIINFLEATIILALVAIVLTLFWRSFTGAI